jgi:hypothetical protein
MDFDELKRRTRQLIERGILGLEADAETVLALVDACVAAEEIEALRAVVLRRQYRAEEKPEWMTDAEYAAACGR